MHQRSNDCLVVSESLSCDVLDESRFLLIAYAAKIFLATPVSDVMYSCASRARAALSPLHAQLFRRSWYFDLKLDRTELEHAAGRWACCTVSPPSSSGAKQKPRGSRELSVTGPPCHDSRPSTTYRPPATAGGEKCLQVRLRNTAPERRSAGGAVRAARDSAAPACGTVSLRQLQDRHRGAAAGEIPRRSDGRPGSCRPGINTVLFCAYAASAVTIRCRAHCCRARRAPP